MKLLRLQRQQHTSSVWGGRNWFAEIRYRYLAMKSLKADDDLLTELSWGGRRWSGIKFIYTKWKWTIRKLIQNDLRALSLEMKLNLMCQSETREFLSLPPFSSSSLARNDFSLTMPLFFAGSLWLWDCLLTSGCNRASLSLLALHAKQRRREMRRNWIKKMKRDTARLTKA